MDKTSVIKTKFRFKQFEMYNSQSAMKISTDSVLLGCWVDTTDVKSALDAGSGTGLLSLMLAQRGVKNIIGIEADEIAYNESKLNIYTCPWSDSIEIIHSDITTLALLKFDLVISNPPYFDSLKYGINCNEIHRNMARHEINLTYEWLINSSRKILTPSGRLCFISPNEREDDITFMSCMAGLYPVRKCFVTSSPKKPFNRILWDLRFGNHDLQTEEIYIRDEKGNFTDTYINLTKDFYVKF